MTTTSTTPPVRHRTWCGPDCDLDVSPGGELHDAYHWSTWEMAPQAPNGETATEFAMCVVDNYDHSSDPHGECGHTYGHLRLSGFDDCNLTPGDLNSLAAWLIDCADRLRAAQLGDASLSRAADSLEEG